MNYSLIIDSKEIMDNMEKNLDLENRDSDSFNIIVT